ncbi:DNA repair protein RadA [Variovorax sp. RB2P76]|jgi:DNA repair protein RadA/Sms|uniref:DNA repair protein RadA n=1 Tax=unclassified Variovorax TaxID=663243 RepID=UPI003F48D862
MAKDKTLFVCSECGGTSPKWLGKCPSCGAWNTLVEQVAGAGAGGGAANNRFGTQFASLAGASELSTLSEIEATDVARTPTGLDELDRVLGGGIVSGGVTLIGGDPGIGKSTLLLQAVDALQRAGQNALYVTGEESGAQVALRSKRLGLDHSQVQVLAEIQLEKIIATLDATRPAIAVIDSIQTVYSDQLTSAPGSVAQVRECAAHLTRFAKTSGTAVVLVGHVTKEGALAGPRVLEHMVDTVLYFEGETHSTFRLVRAIKNRFGAVNEIGVFAMTERGLKGVTNPSAIFLSQHAEPVPGSVVLVTLEGTRPMLVEIQALVDNGGPSPRRLSVGLDRDRLAMLLAVLHRHAGVACMDQDVFVNAVGGVRISEPAADLAVMLAITSSLRGKPLPKGFIAFGEVGLAGEVRPAPRGQERLREAAKLGFSVAVVPKANAPRKGAKEIEGLTIHAVERIEEAMDVVRRLD